MPRTRGTTSTAAVQPPTGSKITFGDDDSEDEGSYEAGPSTRTSRAAMDQSEDDEEEEEDSSDDDAPEAVGLGRNEDDVSAAAEMLAQYVPTLN